MSRQKRTSGGQPGNQNARKHGFYSKCLSLSGSDSLEKAVRIEGLDDEIALMRGMIKSIVISEPQNYSLLIKAFSTLTSLTRQQMRMEKRKKRVTRRAVQSLMLELAEAAGIIKTPGSSSKLPDELHTEAARIQSNESCSGKS